MLDTESLSLNNVKPSPLDYPWGLPKSTLTANDGSGSGGYAHSIFKYAAKQLFNQEINQLEFKNLRCVFFSILELILFNFFLF